MIFNWLQLPNNLRQRSPMSRNLLLTKKTSFVHMQDNKMHRLTSGAFRKFTYIENYAMSSMSYFRRSSVFWKKG